MGAWTSVDIAAGPYAWHYEPAPVGAPTGVLGDVLDGLTVATAYSEDHPLHGIPGPHTASFQILVADFADVADLEVGAPVSIIVRNSDAPVYEDYGEPAQPVIPRLPLVQWLGRVSDLDAVPVTMKARNPADPWGDPGPPADTPRLEVSVTCVDYLADLNQITVGARAWPAEPLFARFDRMWEKEGKLPPIGYNYWWGDAAAREAGSPAKLLEIAQQTAMSNWATEHTYSIVPLPRVGNYDPGAFVPVTVDPAGNWIGPGNPLGLEAGDYLRMKATVLPTEVGDPDGGLMSAEMAGLSGTDEDGLPSLGIMPVHSVDPVLGIRVRNFSGGEAAPPLDIATAGTGVQITEVGKVAHVYGEPEPGQPYRINRVYKRPLKGGIQLGMDLPIGLPLVLEDTPTGWRPAVRPLGPMDTVIPADMCLLDTAWRKSKEGAGINKVTVTNVPGDTYSLSYREQQALNGEVEHTFEAVITNDPTNLVWKLLPEAADTKAWATEEVTILEVPDQVQVPWFDAYQQAYWNHAREAVVISGLVAAQNPNGTDWVAGMFVNGTFNLSGGEWTMKIQLRPDVARSRVYAGEFPWYTESGDTLLYGPGEDPYLTARSLAGTALAGLHTFDFDPTVTAYGLRLVRRPD